MGLRARWHDLQPIDRGIIVMVSIAGLALLAVFARNRGVHASKPPVPPAIPYAVRPEDLRNPLIEGLAPATDPASEGRRVAVIINMDDLESVRIGTYYAKKRQVPRSNLILLHTKAVEEVAESTYNGEIEKPITDALKSLGQVDFLVFTHGIPIRIAGNGYSVDSRVATASAATTEKHHGTSAGDFVFIENPYFNKNEAFSSSKYGFYLPCRLDGYTEEDVKALIDHSVEAKASKGPFLLDGAEGKTTQGYVELDQDLGTAAKLLESKGMKVTYNPQPEFISIDEPLEGYSSWGSNDPHFSLDTYHKLKFQPGGIAETFVSTSARTFAPTQGGQSLIADLIKQGVTGVKGYVSEPYTFSMARPSILFDRYVSGYNLAESFWMASIPIRWKEVVVGDPLCRPYPH